MITVALTDDHIVTRKGIKAILELNPGIQVTLEASNGKELLSKLSGTEHLPDIIILDISMPVMNGFDTINELSEKYPASRIIIFSLLCHEDTVINMVTHGACGFISKSADPSTLSAAVIAVHKSGFYLGDLVKKEYLRKQLGNKNKLGFNGNEYLTVKELEFLRLATTNMSYKEIAEHMEVSTKTVENYRDSLFDKLAINNRAALAIYGLKNGLITLFPET